MGLRVWLLQSDEKRLEENCPVKLEHYADCASGDTIVAGTVEQTGIISCLKRHFVLGKIKFWEKETSTHRTPFLRIDNHSLFPNGVVFSPTSWIGIRYHRDTKTIDKTTSLKRVELLSAPDDNFIRKIFATYEMDSLLPKQTDFERHLLVYCNRQHLYHEDVADLSASFLRKRQ